MPSCFSETQQYSTKIWTVNMQQRRLSSDWLVLEEGEPMLREEKVPKEEKVLKAEKML